jgi:CRP/FNR family cyclic AMP-dependent transcriptional regulator
MLECISLFEGFDDEVIDELEKLFKTRKFQKNTVVINEGDESASLYVILTGEVKVYLTDDNGKEVVANILGESEYFGELSIIDGYPRSSSIMTTQASQLATISQQDFSKLLDRYPQISRTLLKNLSQRVRELSETVRSLALLDVYGRLVKLLMGMAIKEGDSWKINSRLTQQDIASRVGSSREMVARILKDLTLGGYVKIEKKQIKILKKLPEAY